MVYSPDEAPIGVDANVNISDKIKSTPINPENSVMIAIDQRSHPDLFFKVEERHDATSFLENGEINPEPFGGHPIRNEKTGKIEYQLTPQEFDLLQNEDRKNAMVENSSAVPDIQDDQGILNESIDKKLKKASRKIVLAIKEKNANEQMTASAALLEKTANLSNQQIFEDKGMLGFEGSQPLFSRENVSGFDKPVPLKIQVDPRLLNSGEELYVSTKRQIPGTGELVPVIFKVRQSLEKIVYKPVEGNELKLLFGDIASGLKQKSEGKDDVSIPEIYSLGVFKDPGNNKDPLYAFVKPEPVTFKPVIMDMVSSKEKTPEQVGIEYLKLL